MSTVGHMRAEGATDMSERMSTGDIFLRLDASQLCHPDPKS